MLKPVNSDSAEIQPLHNGSETLPETDLLDAYSQAVIAASEKVSPSVVHIKIKKKQKVYNEQLKPGDVIIGFNFNRVSNVNELHRMLDENTIGKMIVLDVLRKGKKERINVVPAELV